MIFRCHLIPPQGIDMGLDLVIFPRIHYLLLGIVGLRTGHYQSVTLSS